MNELLHLDPVERLRSFDHTFWVTPKMAATAFARPERTIRTWIRAGRVRSMCVLGPSRMLVVYWPDVWDVNEVTPRRVRVGA